MQGDVQWFDPSVGSPAVSVSRAGLTFNRAAVLSLEKAAFVEVGVDTKNRRLVVRKAADGGKSDTGEGEGFASESHETGGKLRPGHSLPFCRPGEDTPFVRVTNRELLRFVKGAIPDLPVEGATKYLARLDVDTGYLVVDLKQPVVSRRVKRMG